MHRRVEGCRNEAPAGALGRRKALRLGAGLLGTAACTPTELAWWRRFGAGHGQQVVSPVMAALAEFGAWTTYRIDVVVSYYPPDWMVFDRITGVVDRSSERASLRVQHISIEAPATSEPVQTVVDRGTRQVVRRIADWERSIDNPPSAALWYEYGFGQLADATSLLLALEPLWMAGTVDPLRLLDAGPVTLGDGSTAHRIRGRALRRVGPAEIGGLAVPAPAQGVAGRAEPFDPVDIFLNDAGRLRKLTRFPPAPWGGRLLIVTDFADVNQPVQVDLPSPSEVMPMPSSRRR